MQTAPAKIHSGYSFILVTVTHSSTTFALHNSTRFCRGVLTAHFYNNLLSVVRLRVVQFVNFRYGFLCNLLIFNALRFLFIISISALRLRNYKLLKINKLRRFAFLEGVNLPKKTTTKANYSTFVAVTA